MQYLSNSEICLTIGGSIITTVLFANQHNSSKAVPTTFVDVTYFSTMSFF